MSDQTPAPGPADESPTDERPADETPAEPRVVGEAVVRRVPRYRAWVVTGGLVGLVVGLLLVLLWPSEGDAGLGMAPVAVFVALVGVVVAALLGALVAVLVERARR
ncbi:hypothetical protein GXB85_04915 [Cellulomonas sp. APG4]|uniref:hypothetical protein n=1 Tax=Cellulomonas sp. APG4 TaxID=1538656 RepID=UPI00137B3871|nr:hypothetical protein [Cellulomonas sp. APG4]NCT90293.1 hypothetical protein [Cellulomonas sp. APG4]